MEGSSKAHYLGEAEGEDFLEACKNFIAEGHSGEIRIGDDGKEYACFYGCRWFPTLKEAQKSFG